MSTWKQQSRSVLMLIAVMFVGCESLDPYVTNPDPSRLKQLLSLAESGDVRAQNCLGIYYDFGDSENHNQDLAAKWYRRAALNGDAMSSYMLSRMASGTNQTHEGNSSIFWMMLAAKQGHKTAKADISLRYSSGKEIKKNIQLSVAWGQGILDGRSQQHIGDKLRENVSGFSKEENEKANKLCALIGEATKQKLWKKELEQGMGDTNLMDFAWTHEYLSRTGVLLSDTPVQAKSNKALFDELSPDKISYVLIGDGKEYMDLVKENFWSKEIYASAFNAVHLITNRQSILMLTTELKRSKVTSTYGIVTSCTPTELYVSKTGEVLAQVYTINGYPYVTVKKGSVIKKKDQFYVKWVDGEYGEFVVCRSDTYSKMLSKLLKDKDK
jgi:hypothetical protein